MISSVACIGECMVELREQPDGRFTRGYGGDTLNTALYMARLGVAVDFVTALGDDTWSDEMVASWKAERIGIDLVMRVPGRTPGLYIIQTDDKGERHFSYWRDSAPARDLFALPQTATLANALVGHSVIYCSGITLSLYGEAGLERLFEMVGQFRANGGRFAFDTNFRPRGWPNRDAAKRAYHRAFDCADILLASTEDLDLLSEGGDGTAVFLACRNPSERILKLGEPACRVIGEGVDLVVRAVPVTPVDTTAAGDSFAAAYLAARLSGASLEAAAHAGHRLAGIVVLHPGAVIPKSAMPEGLPSHLDISLQEKTA